MCSSLCQTDPFWTASSLSPSDHREAQNQSICSLAELLELAKGNATLLLNLRDPPREHPYRGSFLNVTLEALLRSGFPQHQVRPCSAPLPYPPGNPGLAGAGLQHNFTVPPVQTSVSTFVEWG